MTLATVLFAMTSLSAPTHTADVIIVPTMVITAGSLESCRSCGLPQHAATVSNKKLEKSKKRLKTDSIPEFQIRLSPKSQNESLEKP